MSGYDLSRFVDLTHTDVSELTCSICQDIFRNPVVANCCLQTFCEYCIKEWLRANKTCPYDRKELNENHLSRPPRLLTNMLGKLEIHCINKKNGCDEILKLENLDLHEKSCLYVKSMCDSCKCQMSPRHNCVKSLLETKYMLIELSEDLKTEINSLKSENENYLRTIQQLSHYQKIKNPSDNPLEIVIEAQNYLDSPVIDSNQTSREITDRIVEIVKNAVKENLIIRNICEKITKSIHSEMDGHWNCQAFYDNIGYNHSLKYPDFNVRIDFGKLSIIVYKSYDDIDIKRLSYLISFGKIAEEIIVEKSNFDDISLVTLREIIFESLRSSKTLGELSVNITESCAEIFDSSWHCFVYKNNYANYSAQKYKGKYVSLLLSDLKILIFQAQQ